jgi:hypothetical protein
VSHEYELSVKWLQLEPHGSKFMTVVMIFERSPFFELLCPFSPLELTTDDCTLSSSDNNY